MNSEVKCCNQCVKMIETSKIDIGSVKALSKVSRTRVYSQNWRDLIESTGMRKHIVTTLIKFSTDLYKHKGDVDQEKSAASIEDEIYVAANSREEYYKTVAARVKNFDDETRELIKNASLKSCEKS